MVQTVRYPSVKAAREAGVKLPANVRSGGAKRKRRPKAVIEAEKARARAAEARARTAEATAERTEKPPKGKGVQVAQPYGQILMAMMAIGLLYVTNAGKYFRRVKAGKPLV